MTGRRVVTPALVAASLIECWSPHVVAEVDDVYVKVAKAGNTVFFGNQPPPTMTLPAR